MNKGCLHFFIFSGIEKLWQRGASLSSQMVALGDRGDGGVGGGLGEGNGGEGDCDGGGGDGDGDGGGGEGDGGGGEGGGKFGAEVLDNRRTSTSESAALQIVMDFTHASVAWSLTVPERVPTVTVE